MGLVPPDLTNESFALWLKEQKHLDAEVAWDYKEARRARITPVYIVNSVFQDPSPELVGWAHRFNFRVAVTYMGKIPLLALDLKGHRPDYRDRCSDAEIGTQSHLHVFDENCPGYVRREPAPPEWARLGNDPEAALRLFVARFNIRDIGIQALLRPAANRRLAI